jgi:aminodeoxyfutalosine deaminase
MDPSEQTLTARWIFPVDRPPLNGGTITLRGETILSVDPHGIRKADRDLGDVAILPGLVNPHTHLDLSGLHGQVPPTADFTAWLRTIVAARRQSDPAEIPGQIQRGLSQILSSGTTLLGDIASYDTWPMLADAPVRSVVFREILGLPAKRVPDVWKSLIDWTGRHPETESCRHGVSPHAPYSVNAALIRAASSGAWPVCIHLAESADEAELLEYQSGPFVPFLKDLGVWEESGLAPSWEWILWRASRAPSAIFAHGNFLPPHLAIPPNSTIVYCPRTHAAFGHPPHPFREFLARGVRVALATDSLASNPDLDVLAEAAFVHRAFPDVAGETLLRMITLSGAEALGFANVCGSLTPGKSADLVCIPLTDRRQIEPHAALFQSDLSQPRTSMSRGRWRNGISENS